MLNPILSRQRQKRLLEVMSRRRLDAAVIGAAHHVYYFTTHWTFVFHQSALVLWADGRSILYTANAPNTSAAADDVRSFEANWRGTLRQDQPRELAQILLRELESRSAKRIGMDASIITSQSSTDSAIGFSQIICLPACAARITNSLCNEFGVTT